MLDLALGVRFFFEFQVSQISVWEISLKSNEKIIISCINNII